MKQLLTIRSTIVIFAFLVLIVLASCGEAPVKETEPEKPATLFYPSLPDSPRIQYLTTFSKAEDVLEKGEESVLAKFVLGEVDPEDVEGPNKPYGVAISEGKIYVVDTRGGGYAIFDLAKKAYRFVTGTGAYQMPKPVNITVDEEGMKYVTDTSSGRVNVFDREDQYVRSYGQRDQFIPTDVAVVGERVYVVDIAHHQVQVLDKQSGNLLFTISGAGADEDKLYHPTNIAVGPDNYLYISDTGNFRVQKFSLEGKHITSFGAGVGTAPGNFARPKGIALDREGRLYVVDAAFENVQIFNKEGRLLLFFGEPAANHPAGLDLPTDIDISYESVRYFQQYADPKFKLEYVILVANQFGRNKVNVYGFGHMEGMDYSEDE